MSEGAHPVGHQRREGPRTAPAVFRQLIASRCVVAAAALSAAACDLGTPETTSGRGPPLHVIAAYPPSGAGEDCPLDAPDDCGVPVGSPIELRFDRYLLPSTVSRDAIAVYTADLRNRVYYLAPTYDLLERVVTFRPEYGSQLLPGVVYQVELALPGKAPGGTGPKAFDGAPLKAFDGAPLEKDRVPLKWSFRTSRVAVQPTTVKPPPTCDDAVKVLQKSGCGRCHAGEDSTYGLDLHSGAGLTSTAIGRVAHETASWASPESPLENAPRFGTAMALIAPGNPSTSYLLYKLFVNARNFDGDGACTTAHAVPLAPGECLVPPSAERTRLGDWFVAGDPMPPDGASLAGGIADLKALIAFIQSSTAQCNGVTDGG